MKNKKNLFLFICKRMACINHQLRVRRNLKEGKGECVDSRKSKKLKILKEAELSNIEKIAGDGEEKKVDIKNK